MKPFIAILFISFIFIFGCNHNLSKKESRLETALNLAGENRSELEKVLYRYSRQPADSLRYRAACFLIENMPGHYYYEGKDLDKYGIYFKCLSDRDRTPSEILDSLSAVYGEWGVKNLTRKFDIEEIDSAYLCENIDLSFTIWQNAPWGHTISFEEFCEYILPYRLGNERLTNWRKEYYHQTKRYLDNYSEHLNLDVRDPVVAAKCIREAIVKEKGTPRFTLMKPSGYPNVDANIAKFFNGTCDDIVQFTVFTFRSIGIPCFVDYLPMRNYGNTGHSWVAIKNSKGEYYTMDFFGRLAYLSDATIHSTQLKSKVYRKTYARDHEAIEAMSRKEKEVPGVFSWNNYRFKDVTPLYSNDLTELKLSHDFLYEKINNRLVYFCVPSRLNWVPIDWTIAENNSVTFKNINAGGIFRIAYFQDGKLTFVTDPLRINDQGRELKKYPVTGDAGIEDIVLFSKYPLETQFKERMIGGVFEGSNNISFTNPDTFHTIKQMPFRLLNEVNVHTDKKYRYVRYRGPSNGHCNVAEIAFYSDSTYLTGEVIGTPGSFNNSKNHLYTNVFDGSTETSFDHNTPDNGWAGLDLGCSRKITKIIYTPRNRDNFIRKGHLYELFQCDREGWVSLGSQVATSDSLKYTDVPRGALLYLRNHTAGNEEILFFMDEGKQLFKLPNISPRYL